MATLIDLYNNTPESLISLVNSIQKRYLDPYTIRLTTDTNNYFFVESEINKIISTAYGNNVLVKGLDVTNIQYSTDYVDIYISKGIAICDNTIIEFTDDIILRVSKADLDISNTDYNVIGIDYVHAQVYPPRVAFPFAVSINNTGSYNVSAVIGVFKTDGSSTTYLNPNNGELVEELTVNINGTEFKVLPSYGTIQDSLKQIAAISGDTLSQIGYPTSNFDSSVTDGMLVYLNSTDGKFYPAICDGTEKSFVVGIADVTNSFLYTTGIVSFGIFSSFNPGDNLYLSATNPGEITTTQTECKIGIALGNNKILFGSSVGGGGLIDSSKIVDFEDLTYSLLLNSNPFKYLYYDKLDSDTLTVSQGTVTYDKLNSKYVFSDTAATSAVLVTPNITLNETSYRFLVHVESSVAPSTVEYSIDGGSTWNTCNLDEVTLISSGASTLQFRFTFTSDGEIYSWGVLYYYDFNSYTTDTRMFEVLNVDTDIPAGTNITLPNNATYTTDGKSLEVYLNGLRLINGVDFTEVDNRTIQLTSTNLVAGDTLIFTEKYGYVDTSVDNYQKLQSMTPSWTNNLADYIVLRDQTTGIPYKIYIDNDQLIFEPLS